MNKSSPLADLDELVLLCRDARARSYIAEATSCYRAGAFRSAIVAAWIAVCYDIIDKLRELHLAGDPQAEALLRDMDRARTTNNLPQALKFERELLEHARDKFELISHLEYLDLDRLQEDRNRCAHPSLASDEEAFDPPGELARLHIRSAVTHLLQHPPAQGKYALDRLITEVNSDYFPTEHAKAVESLSSGPLRRPRESLTRNFVVILLKTLFSGGMEWKARFRYFCALNAVRTLQPYHFHNVVYDKLTALIRAAPDKNLNLVIDLISRFPDIWKAIEVGMQHRIETFVRFLPAEHLAGLRSLIDTPCFTEPALLRLRRTTREELRKVLFMDFNDPIGDRYVEIYLESKDYNEANEWGKEISMYGAELTAAQQQKLIAGTSRNNQLLKSHQLPSVIRSLRDSEKIPTDEFDKLLNKNGLSGYELL